MIHLIKSNKPKCFICHNPNPIGFNSNLALKYQNMIYPCLCNILAHRYCMKQYIISNQLPTCPICCRDYAIGKSENEILKHIPHSMVTACICKLFRFFLIILAIILIMIYINSVGSYDNNAIISTWKIILIILFAICIALIILYGGCMLKTSLNRLKLKDFELYCYQTEIAYHNRNSKEIFKKYIEGIEEENYSIDMDDHENNLMIAHDSEIQTNMSLLSKNKKKQKNKQISSDYLEKNQIVLSKILDAEVEFNDKNQVIELSKMVNLLYI